MARTKLKKLSIVKDLPNVFDLETEAVQNEINDYFKPDHLFTLEIGCGHGDYSIELAKRFPKRVFIGIDIKGARVYLGAMKAIEEKLDNVAFIVGRAEKLNEAFKFKSVEEIYIPFPDPHVRRANENRRLISDHFLKVYKELLTDSGVIHFKTDNQGLYEYVQKIISEFGCEILYSTENLYNGESKFEPGIITNFEKHYVKDGRRIKYIRFGYL
jgi:tRNA (guanine-N7-)-methyltransferase